MQKTVIMFILVASCICSNGAPPQPSIGGVDADHFLKLRFLEISPATFSLNFEMENRSSKTIVAWDYQVQSVFEDGTELRQGHVVDTYYYSVPLIRESMDDPKMADLPHPTRPLAPGEKRIASFPYSVPDGKKVTKIEMRVMGVVFGDLTAAGNEERSIGPIFSNRRDDREKFRTIHAALKDAKETREGVPALRRRSKEILESAESTTDPKTKARLQALGNEFKRLSPERTRPTGITEDRILDFWIKFYAGRFEAADKASRRPQQ